MKKLLITAATSLLVLSANAQVNWKVDASHSKLNTRPGTKSGSELYLIPTPKKYRKLLGCLNDATKNSTPDVYRQGLSRFQRLKGF